MAKSDPVSNKKKAPEGGLGRLSSDFTSFQDHGEQALPLSSWGSMGDTLREDVRPSVLSSLTVASSCSKVLIQLVDSGQPQAVGRGLMPEVVGNPVTLCG